MAVAFDAASFKAIAGDDSLTHTPVGTPRGAVALIVQSGSASDLLAGVTYGGEAMARERFAADALTEAGAAYLYVLGAGLPGGAQTVAIDATGALTACVWIVTVTAAGDVEVAASGIVENNVDDPGVVLATLAGFAGVVVAALYSGLGVAANIGPGAGYTALAGSEAAGHDFGVNTAAAEHGAKSGANVAANFTTTTEDDVALVAVALQEAAGGSPQTVDVAGVASEEAFGAVSVSALVDVAGVASEEAFGAVAIAFAFDVAGVASEEAFGAVTIEGGAGGSLRRVRLLLGVGP